MLYLSNIKKLKNHIVVAMCLMSVFGVNAQEGGVGGGIVAFNYSMGFTVGSSRDFISDYSGRGGNLDIRYNIAEQISVGAIVGWNYFYERKDRQSYNELAPDGSSIQISSVQSRYLNIIPLMAQGYYTFVKGLDGVKPYVGLGIGGAKVDYEKYWGNVLEEEESWEFAFAPSVGVILPFGEGMSGLNVQARYNYVNFSYSDVDKVSYFDLNLGLYFDF
jgi:opacity protein-like surface antigen